MTDLTGAKIHISGIVQGVGFRPFVFNLAKQHQLTGWVKNTSAGVDIQIDGQPTSIEEFTSALKTDPPPLAQIDSFTIQDCPANGFSDFEIILSESIQDAFQPISPDVCICQDCLRELFDPQDRRYRYPFINCTNCGPRFTIIKDIPYDRPKTTMAGFTLCPDCAREYHDPHDRRFHAQPVACPICGPHIWLETTDENGNLQTIRKDELALQYVQEMLKDGAIVAIKGLGGFHLACDAANSLAVEKLRQRKLRVEKPFALMMVDIDAIMEHCEVLPSEHDLLVSIARPIVLLERKTNSNISPQVAPGQKTLGVMLPYTPLHYLLFSRSDPEMRQPARALVMTSANLSEEPIVTDNEEARQRLATLADAFLMHDRPIQTRCDDSVLRVFSPMSAPFPIRRARGFAPFPIHLAWKAPQILAVGAELKNTFCITHDDYAFLSHHIGDLENYETLQAFEKGIAHYERLFRVAPAVLVHDLHPNYLATRYALERAEQQQLVSLGVQHHHAHIASAMAEHRLPPEETVIGVAFDGTGYGDDGAIWGGEFLLANYAKYQRVGHLEYTPLPGGDAATRKPARQALAYLWRAGIDWDPKLPSVSALSSQERLALQAQLERHVNTPLTSSLGRLFDAVASLAGVRQQINYEAQAAIEFEALHDQDETGCYPFEIINQPIEENGSITKRMRLDPKPLIEAVVHDVLEKVSPCIISARFHNSLTNVVCEASSIIRQEHSINTVILSGGVWQNMHLLSKTYAALRLEGFKVLTHRLAPANDGGLSLGQAAIAAYQFR